MAAKKKTETETVVAGPENLDLWNSVEKTHPKYAKAFSRGGGFKGTAINPTYMTKKATEAFGPIGSGWGFEVINENYVEGAPLLNADGVKLGNEIIHVVYCKLWYTDPKTGEICSVYQYGQTTFVGKNRHGFFTDEEAPKKSMTDAMTKSMSLLGFSADIFLGMWDDSKYVNDRKREVIEEAKAESVQKASSTTSVRPEEVPPPEEVPAAVEGEVMPPEGTPENEGDALTVDGVINMVGVCKTMGELTELKNSIMDFFKAIPEKATRNKIAKAFADKGAELGENA